MSKFEMDDIDEFFIEDLARDRHLEKYFWGFNTFLHVNSFDREKIISFMLSFPQYLIDTFYNDFIPKLFAEEDIENNGVMGRDEFNNEYKLFMDEEDRICYEICSGELIQALYLFPNSSRRGDLFCFDDGNTLFVYSGEIQGEDVYLYREEFPKEKIK